MLSNHIKLQIYNNFPYTPTNDQKILIELLGRFISGEDDSRIFLLNGHAGTGKTTVISALVKTLNAFGTKNFMVAPTGRAAKVMAQYSGQRAVTIHKKIYQQQSIVSDRFVLKNNREKGAFFIVDEVSMIANQSFENTVFGSGRLLDDIFEYVISGQGCKILLIGDSAQLPPVGTLLSPALDRYELERFGAVTAFSMREVVRHELDSGILYNATLIRSLIEEQRERIPQFELGFPDVEKISGGDFLECLEDAYSKYGRMNTMIITRSNKQSNRINQGVRSRVLFQENLIDSGDYIMIVKNNYFYTVSDTDAEAKEKQEDRDFLANGDIARIVKVRRYEEVHGFRFADITLELLYADGFELDCKILLDTLLSDTPSLSSEQYRSLFESVERDYAHITRKNLRYKAMREDPYLNALQVKFAYSVTCHKAQGGQWDCVFLDRMLWNEEPMSLDLLRWLYTAFTRAVKKVYLLNFDERFFAE